ncbi:MAG: CHAT domain-containing protein [Acidimicrobiales bacterium]|nr:CHAT domain-containing protein [Acidimicrobiales bacterium]
MIQEVMGKSEEVAEGLIDLAGSEPQRAIAEAADALDGATGRSRLLIQLALGLAHRNQGNISEALSVLTDTTQQAAGEPDILDRVELSLAAAEAMGGDFNVALDRMDALLERVDSELYGRAAHQRAGILQRSGDSAGAKLGYRDALDHFIAAGDDLGQGHLHGNLGILLAYDGEISSALDELALSQSAYERADQEMWVARTIHNRGWATSCLGDLPRALTLYDEADRRLAAIGSPSVQFTTARVETLMRAGLNRRALDVLAETIDQLGELGLEADRAEALVLAGEAAFRAGQTELAAEYAQTAVEILNAQGRDGWAGLAQVVLMGASGDAIEDLEQEIQRLAAAGHTAAALRLLLARAEIALASDDSEAVDACLALQPDIQLTIEESFHLDSIQARTLAARRLNKDALAKCAATLARVERFMGETGSLEFIGGNIGSLHRLVDTAKALTVDNPDEYVEWSDSLRSIAISHWPLAQTDSAGWLLAKYRACDQEVRQDPNDNDARARLNKIRRDLEEHSLQDSARPGSGTTAVIAPLGTTDISVRDDNLVICRNDESGTRQRIVPYDRALFAAMDRAHQIWMADPRPNNSVARRCEDLAVACEELLFGADDVSITTIVIDPELRHFPFGTLPRLASEAFSVALARRARRHYSTHTSRSRVLIVDDGLESSVDGEVPEPHGWERPEPGIGPILSALDGAAVVHLRGHGGAEPDNPMFSWLGVGDERLFLYDLARLERAPVGVVIAACLGARASELYQTQASFAEGFLGTGAEWVVASPTVVADDEAVRSLLNTFHTELENGLRPEQALAHARSAARAGGTPAIAGAFTCYRASAAATA